MSEQKTFVVTFPAEEAMIVFDSSKALGISQSAVIRAAVRMMHQVAQHQAKTEILENGKKTGTAIEMHTK